MPSATWHKLYAQGVEQEEWSAQGAHCGTRVGKSIASLSRLSPALELQWQFSRAVLLFHVSFHRLQTCLKALSFPSLTPPQEVCEWLRDRKNRTRYLDDLVWLIHDRFGIVCSTTTMSKMRRKWIRVIDFEENGTPIDESTRAQLMETHPDLPLLHQQEVPQAQMGTMGALEAPMEPQQQQMHHAFQPTHQAHIDSQLDQQMDQQLDQQLHEGLSGINGMGVQHLG